MTTTPNNDKKIYDIAIIGGGINGVGIARDAAGRGLTTYLCDKQDLGAATSAASTKLIHGGLRYLETYDFMLVRKALKERSTLLKMAPHLIKPLSFVLPHQKHLRPKWMLRAGLFLYDHLANLGKLHKSFSINLQKNEVGNALSNDLTTAFCYSDCWVDDHRLVILNARDAQNRGATIKPFNACLKAEKDAEQNLWKVTTEQEVIYAKSLVNAAGPWAQHLIENAIPNIQSRSLRLVKGSHIVVPKLFGHDKAYLFQQPDGRIVFAIPYEQDFTLIGTTDEPYNDGDLNNVICTEEAKDYLCQAVNSYFKKQLTAKDVVWSYAGVRPLIEDRDDGNASKASRDYRVSLREVSGLPLLNIWGGKITTYRVLAENAIEKLSEHLPVQKSWTKTTPLLGGDFYPLSQQEYAQFLKAKYPFLSLTLCQRFARSYGCLSQEILNNANAEADLGKAFAPDFYQIEVDYLCEKEWATTAAAILFLRTKLGLHLNDAEKENLTQYLKNKE